ncbi:hydroxysqualene dehydroxylase HpnE [Ferribacterium limneticum]|uniref:hydroxysqualene dehydroxylase HpnE n=1 Tax=Ferribacterium limneticum TaxID=76259 RepID=UPI001CFA73ED|nr:hydroxysqualene dehydroxylase HpnE [Ferribacterium limneticum]UCV29941.1 hydroxysqualene dehydroxylase HpnE [Ferribacterium limneticum]UCV33860.1 hydroxysqualene dehydroxylase HpnE [Ferribacterium limneticum]
MRVAVIGGGWAGLAAAVELTAAGVQTTLYEAGRVLGGRARGVEVDGRRLDNGQHILLGAYRDTLALMRRVGADPDELFARRPLRVIDNTGFRLALPRLPAPLNVAWGLLSASGVSLGEKLRTALWMDGIKRRGFKLARETTVAEWLDDAGQTGALRRHLWEPLCLAALNLPAERASAQLFANVLRDSLGSSRREDTDLLLPRVDLGQLLPEPAGRWLQAHGAQIRLSRRVSQITEAESGIAIDGEPFTAAIIATAPQHVGALWPAAATNYAYEPIATVYRNFVPKMKSSFPLSNRLGGHCQWVVDRGDGMLACVLSGHGEWEKLDDAALAAALDEELGLPNPNDWQKVIREKRATFSACPGLHRPDFKTANPRLVLAGDYTWADYPATLEGAVRSGLRAARQITNI